MELAAIALRECGKSWLVPAPHRADDGVFRPADWLAAAGHGLCFTVRQPSLTYCHAHAELAEPQGMQRPFGLADALGIPPPVQPRAAGKSMGIGLLDLRD